MRRIFREYAAARSPREIARRLNAEGVPGPGGRPWGDTTIRGHALRGTGLLHNELYVGRLVWNRQRYIKDPKTGRRVARLNPESAWIIQEVPELRIVDDALWATVQARLTATPGIAGGRQGDRDAVLEAAAAAASADRPRPLRCLRQTARRSRPRLSRLRRRPSARGLRQPAGHPPRGAGEHILDALRSRLMQPDLVAEFAEAWQQEVNRQGGADVARDRAARELAQVERKLAGLIDAIANGLRAPSLQQMLDDLERRRAELAHRLATAPAPLPRLHPNLAEVYRRKVTELGAALRDPHSGAEALAILRGLIDRVSLTPAADHFAIELEGALAGMLALAQGGNTGPGGGVSDVFRSSVKVVAPAITRCSASTSSAISNGACCAGATSTAPRTGGRCWRRWLPATGSAGYGATSAPMPPSPRRRSTRFSRPRGSSTPSGCRPTPFCSSESAISCGVRSIGRPMTFAAPMPASVTRQRAG